MPINLRKKPKAAVAPKAPKTPMRIQQNKPLTSTLSRNGGTTAPPPKQPKPPKVGLGAGSGGTGYVPKSKTQAPAPPPPAPVPVIPHYGPPPASMSTAEKRMYADQEWNRIQGDIKTQLYLAALAYGDPDVIKQYGSVVPTPTGALQVAAREAGENRKTNVLAHNANNTFFSGMNLEDIRKIGDAEAFKKKEALDAFNKAQVELNKAMSDAEEARNRMMSEADREDFEAYEASQPEPQAPPPPSAAPAGGGGGGKGGGFQVSGPINYYGIGGNTPAKKKGKK